MKHVFQVRVVALVGVVGLLVVKARLGPKDAVRVTGTWLRGGRASCPGCEEWPGSTVGSVPGARGLRMLSQRLRVSGTRSL